jgi:fatty-acyl-CoA synthase/long-chain acyl-CoA synthetase
VAAVIRPTHGADPLPKTDIIDYVGSRLAPFKVPVRWFITDALPVTPTGKVRKFELRDSVVNGRLREI